MPCSAARGSLSTVAAHRSSFTTRSSCKVPSSSSRRPVSAVFVSDGEVLPLGIEDRVTINPITFSAGYRFRTSSTLVSYVGGGAGSYRLRETSDFADPSENVDERHTAYHALGGVEFGISKWVLAAFEAQYTTVPDGLGGTGVAEAFGETNLGGTSLRFKVLVGR